MPAFFRGNPTFFAVMGLIVISQVLIVQYGGTMFGTVPLSLAQWIKIIVLSASVLVVGFVLRRVHPYIQKEKSRIQHNRASLFSSTNSRSRKTVPEMPEDKRKKDVYDCHKPSKLTEHHVTFYGCHSE